MTNDVVMVLTAWTMWRVVKLVAFAVLAGGVLATVSTPTRRVRLAMTYGYAVPGFVVTWAAGYMLMKHTGRALTEPFIVAAILASLAMMGSVFALSHKAARRSGASALVAVGGLVAAVATMVARSTDPVVVALVTLVGGVVGALVALPLRAVVSTTDPSDAMLAWRGFRWLAWAEGGSLLVLLLVKMPLERLAGIQLDGGTGFIGWTHGVLVIAYLHSLWSVSRMFGWSRRTLAAGFAAALLPGAAFVFERRVGRTLTAQRGE